MKKTFTDVDLNRSVGNLLRLGVILSVTTSLIGFIKLFLEGFKMPKDYSFLNMGTSSEKVWGQFWNSLCKGEGMAIIQLGILLLIFTPLMRIIFALIGYLKEKDYTYVIISSIVLVIMIISFVTGYAH
jgi:Predicted membrane protein